MIFPAREGAYMFGSLENFSASSFCLALCCKLFTSPVMVRAYIIASEFRCQGCPQYDIAKAKVSKS